MTYSVCFHSHTVPSRPYNDTRSFTELTDAEKFAEEWTSKPGHLASIYGPPFDELIVSYPQHHVYLRGHLPVLLSEESLCLQDQSGRVIILTSTRMTFTDRPPSYHLNIYVVVTLTSGKVARHRDLIIHPGDPT